MLRAFIHSVCVWIALAAVLATAAAEEAKEEEKSEGLRWVWYPTAKCTTKPEEGMPGSSPNQPITVRDFANLKLFAMLEADGWEPEDEGHFKPDCKWIRLTGFFRWYNYYHYRGQIFENANSYYFKPSANYIIEDYLNPATRTGDLQARRITLVGRFYNLCAAAKRDEEKSGEDWRIMGGPCHYGDDKGMMLTDVMIEKIHDDAPRFLTGEQNRAVIRELVAYEGEDIGTLRKKVRDWAGLVKKGTDAYAEHKLSTDPFFEDKETEYIQGIRQGITDADSYVSYLSGLRAFQEINLRTAPVAVFHGSQLAEYLQMAEAVGCICLERDCRDKWPLLSDDAKNFVGAAACTTLSRSKEDPVWRW